MILTIEVTLSERTKEPPQPEPLRRLFCACVNGCAASPYGCSLIRESALWIGCGQRRGLRLRAQLCCRTGWGPSAFGMGHLPSTSKRASPSIMSYFSKTSGEVSESIWTIASGILLWTTAIAVSRSETRTTKAPRNSGPPAGSGRVVMIFHPSAMLRICARNRSVATLFAAARRWIRWRQSVGT
jgi:hypothetical protein